MLSGQRLRLPRPQLGQANNNSSQSHPSPRHGDAVANDLVDADHHTLGEAFVLKITGISSMIT